MKGEHFKKYPNKYTSKIGVAVLIFILFYTLVEIKADETIITEENCAVIGPVSSSCFLKENGYRKHTDYEHGTKEYWHGYCTTIPEKCVY